MDKWSPFTRSPDKLSGVFLSAIEKKIGEVYMIPEEHKINTFMNSNLLIKFFSVLQAVFTYQIKLFTFTVFVTGRLQCTCSCVGYITELLNELHVLLHTHDIQFY